MKILHTSDWHLGRLLHKKRRYDEMGQFFDWLEKTISDHEVDALLVAGDVFDSTTPSNRAQELYYRFLTRMAHSSCRHVVITAGNHDSPAFLEAPSPLLGLLDIHVIGRASGPEKEVLALKDKNGQTELIVCAVPYLYDHDVRTAEAGQDFQDRQRALVRGVSGHYAAVLDQARKIRKNKKIPLVLMGHLFMKGGEAAEGDGVRELYAGTLVQLDPGEIVPPDVSYTALGHLHTPQRVAGRDTIRYSGSPIPMSFGEIKRKNWRKSVCIVDFCDGAASVEAVPIPTFQRLERVQGNWDFIEGRLTELKFTGKSTWLEVVYDGDEPIYNLGERIGACLAGCPFTEVLSVSNEPVVRQAVAQFQGSEGAGLETFSPVDVFERRLDTAGIADAQQREELLLTYQEALQAVLRAGNITEEDSL